MVVSIRLRLRLHNNLIITSTPTPQQHPHRRNVPLCGGGLRQRSTTAVAWTRLTAWRSRHAVLGHALMGSRMLASDTDKLAPSQHLHRTTTTPTTTTASPHHPQQHADEESRTVRQQASEDGSNTSKEDGSVSSPSSLSSLWHNGTRQLSEALFSPFSSSPTTTTETPTATEESSNQPQDDNRDEDLADSDSTTTELPNRKSAEIEAFNVKLRAKAQELISSSSLSSSDRIVNELEDMFHTAESGHHGFRPHIISYGIAMDAIAKSGRPDAGERVEKWLRRLEEGDGLPQPCLLYTSPSPRDGATSRMPSSA